MPTIDDALSYISLGWSIIPVKQDKRPFIPWTRWQTAKPTEAEARSWWSRWPEANIAVVCGPISGIVAVDIDSPVGAEAYKAQFGEIHGTVTQTTGKPGARHLLFKCPPGVKLGNAARALPDVDVRGNGGYILVDPSIHPSGRQYAWEIDPRLSLDDLMELPKEVRSWFWPEVKEAPSDKKERLDVQNMLLGVPRGSRNDACARLAGYYLRLTKGDVGQTKAILGAWNDRNEPPLDWKEVERTVDSIHKRQGREELGEAVGGLMIRKVEILVYPDGSTEYQVYVDGFPGYAKMTAKELVNQADFRVKYLSLTRISFPPIKSKEWHSLITNCLKEAVEIKVDPDETALGLIMDVITRMTSDDRATEDMDRINSHIVRVNGCARFTTGFIANILAMQGLKLSPKDTGTLLRRLGCKKTHANNKGRFWEIDLAVLNPTDFIFVGTES